MAMTTPPTVFDRLIALLEGKGVGYEVLRHAPVRTSAEAAQVRGTPLSSGAKALICSADGRFVLFVLPGDRRLDSKAVRKAMALKSLRFATRDEVLDLTSLTPGAIPPFGQLFGLPTWCDVGLTEEPTISFNAGDHAISVSLRSADYLAVEQPLRAALSEPG
jgi:Ala-tRNA(Pro) deacylase